MSTAASSSSTVVVTATSGSSAAPPAVVPTTCKSSALVTLSVDNLRALIREELGSSGGASQQLLHPLPLPQAQALPLQVSILARPHVSNYFCALAVELLQQTRAAMPSLAYCLIGSGAEFACICWLQGQDVCLHVLTCNNNNYCVAACWVKICVLLHCLLPALPAVCILGCTCAAYFRCQC